MEGILGLAFPSSAVADSLEIGRDCRCSHPNFLGDLGISNELSHFLGPKKLHAHRTSLLARVCPIGEYKVACVLDIPRMSDLYRHLRGIH